MSGIVGIWNLDGEPIDRALLSKLASVQSHRDADGTGVWVDNDIGLVFQNLWVTPESVGEIQPFVCHSESVVLFDGRLDNRDELLSLLRGRVDSESSDAAFVAATYRTFGEAFPEKLLGDFAIAIYDLRERKLLLARDGIGVRPIYFARAGNSFLIASECKPILAHPKATNKPNPDMIAAYFLACFGHEREGWTFFQDIYNVVPGQLVVVSLDSVVKRIYWDFAEPKPIRLGSFQEYAAAFKEQFDRAVTRRLRSAFPVTVALSGGLDSSSIFCAGETLRKKGQAICPSIRSVYIDNPGPLLDERAFIEDIESQYGVDVCRLPRDSSHFIQGSAREGLRIMESPYLRGQADFRFPLEQQVRSSGSRSLLTGHCADQVLATRNYLIDLFRHGKWITASRHLAEYSQYFPPSDSSFFRRDFLHNLARYHVPVSWMPSLREIRKRLSRDRSWFTPALWKRARQIERHQAFRSPGHTAHQRCLYGLIRPMYYVQGMERCDRIGARHQMEYAYPFLDRDLLSFLMAVPGEMICRNGTPKALLRAAMTGTLPASIAERNWKAAGSLEFNRAVDRDSPLYSTLFQEDSIAVALGYLDQGGVSRAIEKLRSKLYDDECLSTRKLTDLIGLELWLKAFFGSEVETIENVKEHREHVPQPV